MDFAADHLAAAAFGSAGERCMAISAAVAVGSAADAVVTRSTTRPGCQGRLGPGRRQRDGAGRDPAGPGAHRRPHRHRGGAGRQGAVDGRGYVVPGYEDGFFVGPTVIDQVTPDHGRLPAGDLRAGALGGTQRRRRRGHRPHQRQPVRQRHGDLHLQRRGGTTVPARRQGRDDRDQRPGACPDGVTTPSGAGRTRSSATSTYTAPKGSASTPAAKVVTARWPHVSHASDASFHFPTAK